MLSSSELNAMSYLFVEIPGPKGELPPGIKWALYVVRSSRVPVDELPQMDGKAIWYDVGAPAGILMYVEDDTVTRVFHGGT
jgi:hypothetical protein